ncbi:MAG: HEAT repeat domain-containing protein [Acidobacteriota bacterium]|nr:HEAT repeat domain-containing protein [Acidobacteriota bacterium]
MTLQDRLVRKYIDQAIAECQTNPLSPDFMRRLAGESPSLFFSAAVRRFQVPVDPGTLDCLTSLLLTLPDLPDLLADPAACGKDSAIGVYRRLLRAAPAFDLRFARNLADRLSSDDTPAFDRAKSLRAIDILEETALDRRLLPIIGHLPSSPDPKIAAKATLYVGKRVRSPAWSARYLSNADSRIRANAIESIWGLRTPQATRLLEQCAGDKNNRVAGNALVGLRIAGNKQVDARVSEMSRDASATIRATAAWMMGAIGTPDWRTPLTQLIRDDDPRARGMALRALARIRDAARVATRSRRPGSGTAQTDSALPADALGEPVPESSGAAAAGPECSPIRPEGSGA